jgi:hypothetical protein
MEAAQRREQPAAALFQGLPMTDPAMIMFFGLALGFAISGVVSNFFQLVTDGASVFHFPVTNDARRFAVVALLILAGPHILLRAADRSARDGDWPVSYTLGCLLLGFVWSFLLGYMALSIVI